MRTSVSYVVRAQRTMLEKKNPGRTTHEERERYFIPSGKIE
jgi:hypothetical protein